MRALDALLAPLLNAIVRRATYPVNEAAVWEVFDAALRHRNPATERRR
jgi:hypothetical protein